jgi:glycerol-3-phosphate dehydrogenase (NAD(P)+)
MRIAVLGAGAWGTAIATTLAARHSIRLWARDRSLLAVLRSSRVNERYLPGIAVPAEIELIDDLARALDGAELALLAVPTNGLRELLGKMRKAGARAPLVWSATRKRQPFHAACCRDQVLPMRWRGGCRPR